jgi:hypothetical protein
MGICAVICVSMKPGATLRVCGQNFVGA